MPPFTYPRFDIGTSRGGLCSHVGIHTIRTRLPAEPRENNQNKFGQKLQEMGNVYSIIYLYS
jgi:hypothetical protein